MGLFPPDWFDRLLSVVLMGPFHSSTANQFECDPPIFFKTAN